MTRFAHITNTDQVRLIATEYGSHFFDASALRFFASRIHRPVYGARYFVTSEQDRGSYDGMYPMQPRAYTVREFTVDDTRRTVTINTVGEFQAYATRHEAHAAAQGLARAVKHFTAEQIDIAVAAATECLMWSSVVGIGDDVVIEASNAHANWSDDALASIEAEVRSFLTLIERDDELPNYGGLDASQIGHDFILTRNGHGAGFWDRGIGAIGDRLTMWAKTYGNNDVYLSDAGELEVI